MSSAKAKEGSAARPDNKGGRRDDHDDKKVSKIRDSLGEYLPCPGLF
jgi:hypothetical protein